MRVLYLTVLCQVEPSFVFLHYSNSSTFFLAMSWKYSKAGYPMDLSSVIIFSRVSLSLASYLRTLCGRTLLNMYEFRVPLFSVSLSLLHYFLKENLTLRTLWSETSSI